MAKFCRFCGRKLRTGSERFCPGCGSDLLGGNNQASQDNGNGWGQPSDDQGIWGRQAASSQGYWRPPQGSSQGNQNRQPENVQNNWTPQPENVQNSWTSQPENNQNNWGTQLESTQNNRSQQSPEGQEIHNQSSQSRPRNHKLRQINVQGNWNQQRNPGPSGVDQNSPNQQMADTGINTSQPTKSQTNKKPVKTKNTSNAGVSVSSGSSGFYPYKDVSKVQYFRDHLSDPECGTCLRIYGVVCTRQYSAWNCDRNCFISCICYDRTVTDRRMVPSFSDKM